MRSSDCAGCLTDHFRVVFSPGLFQNDLSWQTVLIKMTLIYTKMNLLTKRIFITMVLHEKTDAKVNSEMAYDVNKEVT